MPPFFTCDRQAWKSATIPKHATWPSTEKALPSCRTIHEQQSAARAQPTMINQFAGSAAFVVMLSASASGKKPTSQHACVKVHKSQEAAPVAVALRG